jgi:hypothetical protein
MTARELPPLKWSCLISDWYESMRSYVDLLPGLKEGPNGKTMERGSGDTGTPSILLEPDGELSIFVTICIVGPGCTHLSVGKTPTES